MDGNEHPPDDSTSPRTEGAPESSFLIPGQRISHYEIVEVLGSGGMGVLHRARDTNLDREVALKCPWREIAHDPVALRRFTREARAAGRLSHPHIVQVHEVFEHDGLPWLALQFVRGQDLRKVLAERAALPTRDVLHWAEDLASALEHAHANQVLHRDIKPSNVLIAADGRALLTDFGLARALPPIERPESQSTSSTSITRSGTVVGTPAYMSPEQALGRPLDERSDVFSLGAVLFEMCTGRPLVAPAGAEEVVRDLMALEVPSLRKINPAVPAGLERIIRRAVAWHPEERYPSARELAADLRRLRTEQEGRLYLREHAWKRHRVAFGVSAFVLIGVVAAGVAWIESEGPRRHDESEGLKMRALVTWPGQEGDSRFSPDGEWISFVADFRATGRNALWLMKRSGGKPQVIASPLAGIESHVWSPGGQEIACLVSQGDDTLLQIIPAFGGPPTKSVSLASLSGADLIRWIPPRVYLESDGALWRFDLVSDRLEELVSADGALGLRSRFDVRPDEKQIAYGLGVSTRMTVWVANPDGSGARQVTSEAYSAYAPHFRGAQHLVYASNRSGQIDLWSLSLADGSSRQLTSSSTIEMPEDTSADGSMLTFREIRESSHLWIVDPRSQKTRQLTADSLQDFWPRLSRNGALVLHRRNPSLEQSPGVVDTEVLVAALDSVDTLGPRPIAGLGTAASISPDGTLVAYVKPAERRYQLWTHDLVTGHSWLAADRFQLSAIYGYPMDWVKSNLTWSPEGAVLFFVARAEDGAPEIHKVRMRTRQPVPEKVLSAPVTEELSDLSVSPSGRWLGYVRSAFDTSTTSEVRCRNLETAEDRMLRQWNGDVYVRGWLAAEDSIVATLASPGPDRTERLEIVVLGLGGASRSVGSIDRAFGGTARLDALRHKLFLAKADDGSGHHNLYEYALDTGRLRRITDNEIPGVTLSGMDVAADGRVVYARHENNSNIWMIAFNP